MGTHRVMRRWPRGGRSRLVVTLGLGAFVVAVYVVVVVGGGALLGQTSSPSLVLSVLATATVALLIAPVQSVLERAASRGDGDGPPTPYAVLRRFSETVAADQAGTQLPARMSMLLAQGTGAQWAQVWLAGADGLTLAATWPADADADPAAPNVENPPADGSGLAGRRAVGVQHGGQLLGALRLQERPGITLTPVEDRLFVGLAAQAGLALRLIALQTHLEARHRELRWRADELAASRERLIHAQDFERRRLERDIHDGAQQHLVALAVNLRLAQVVAGRAPERAASMLAGQATAARLAIETLSSLARGIYPRQLSDQGLVAALRSAVAASPIPATVTSADIGRLPPALEAALYFCCLEAVQNATKHSSANSVTVRLEMKPAGLQVTITDDGRGFDVVPGSLRGAGLVNMQDRLDAVGGEVTVASGSGVGTTVTALLPSGSLALPVPFETLRPAG
jgi:signal transduction histidine kinase